MNDEETARAREALTEADRAREAGIRVGARPAWYPFALGLSLTFAMGSFAVPWLTITGVALGAVILPVIIDMTARKVSGASPLDNSFDVGSRGPVLASIIIVVVIAAGSITLLKLADVVWGVIVGAIAVGLVTAWCTWWLNRRRRVAGGHQGGGR